MLERLAERGGTAAEAAGHLTQSSNPALQGEVNDHGADAGEVASTTGSTQISTVDSHVSAHVGNQVLQGSSVSRAMGVLD